MLLTDVQDTNHARRLFFACAHAWFTYFLASAGGAFFCFTRIAGWYARVTDNRTNFIKQS